MTVAVPNSAFALNDDAWAKLFAIYFPNGLPWLGSSSGAGQTPVYTTLPMPGGGTAVTPQMTPSGNDLYDLQWHFDYLGDIEKIWDEYSGAGVHVGVYDDGLQYIHPDLAANYDASLQVTVDGEIVDPLYSTTAAGSPTGYPSPHGTAVAGLIAASNNGIGTVGVAWGASLTGVNIFSGSANINNYYAGFLQAVAQSDNFDITNHSWGKYPGFWQDGVTSAMDQSLIDIWFASLETGRGGLGTIHVKAAGNADQNSNGDSSGISRATIVVGAYDDFGEASYYSSYGSNLLVSAPSSGVNGFFAEINKGLVTTDLLGGFPNGYDGLPDTDYTNHFGGTSGATPIVSGIVALMLEANPELGWRDVQNILAYSAREVGSGVGGIRLNNENNVWKYNGADNWNGGGLHYSEDYGFGAVDAFNAVRMAEVWSLFGGPHTTANESSFKQDTTQSVALLDGKTTEIKFQFGGPDFLVDFVNISIDLSHTKLDDLEIYLVSPDGTVSSLVDFRFELAYSSGLTDAVLNFGANGFRGENGAGEWTIRVVDRWLEDEGTVNSASITLHGTDTADGSHNSADDVYHYTNEVLTALARDASRMNLTDTDGGEDWLDMSAMTGNLLVRMMPGNVSMVGGTRFLTIDPSAAIENAVGGDGNDDITGTLGANKIYGMRGDDIIWTGSGDDLLSGGAGNDTLRGGTGNDVFLFDRALNAATNVDLIVDFQVGALEADKIWLDVSIFTALSVGDLDSVFFTIGTAATDALDRVIYDSATGALYYDADGLGGASQIKFAQLTEANYGSHPALSFSDFKVVDMTDTVVVGSGTDRVQDDAPTTSTSTDTENLFGTGAPINGTQYDDEIIGKSGDDVINGLGGNDTISGGDGNDIIDGGEGIDFIFGDAGDDILRGGGSPYSNPMLGGVDWLFGGDGNDILYGSNQQNLLYNQNTNFGGGGGDSLSGDDGDDIAYGYDGDDGLGGGAGNDRLYGGAGSDILQGDVGDDYLDGGEGSDIFYGGEGNDTFIVGRGIENVVVSGDVGDEKGYDVIVFEGNFADYQISGLGNWMFFGPYAGIEVRNITVGDAVADQDITAFDYDGIEKLIFKDQEIDLVERPLFVRGGDMSPSAMGGNEPYVNSGTPLTLTANGWETTAVVAGAGDVTITDAASQDRLDTVRLREVNGVSTINSDRLERLDLANVSGSITVNAAAGTRDLAITTNTLRLEANEKISDDTATSVSLRFAYEGSYENAIFSRPAVGTAGVNGANFSFHSAKTLNIFENASHDVAIRWDIPEVTTIDLRSAFRYVYETTGTFQNLWYVPNIGIINILTPLDDSVLAIGGGSDEFQYIGYEDQGRDWVRFGNLGDVNAGNDGTEGADATTNAGLGLRGTINLGGENDEAWILGSDAFQGGSIDGGGGDGDVIRMTFGVAEAIVLDFSKISNFEVVQLDVTSQDHSVDASMFADITTVVIGGSLGGAGENAVDLVDGSKVIIKSFAGANNFGDVILNGSAGGLDLAFVDRASGYDYYGPEAERPNYDLGSGTIHVTDATVVNITTDIRDDFSRHPAYPNNSQPYPLSKSDAFGQALDLGAATTVTISGDTGWDFTVPGSSIANVTHLDASGVTASGVLGAVIATAQSAQGVTFIGGNGDDVFEGGAGNDTLNGGGGNDTYIVNAGSAGDTIVELADGGTDTVRSATHSVDISAFANVENATLTGNLDLNITGNAGNNLLTGNAGNNVIDGGDGGDTVVFSGAFADYDISEVNGVVTVVDTRGAGGDGTDTLTNVEYYQFSDGKRSVNPTAPTDIQLTTASVREVAQIGTVVGRLTATDAPGDTATFTLVDDAEGRFAIVGDELRVASGTLLDFEQQNSHTITVLVTDLDGLTFEKTFTIAVTDWNPETAYGSDGNDTLHGGAFNDVFSGFGGDDVLRGNGGSDILIGGTGNDTAEFSGSASDYEIVWAKDYTDAFTIRDKRSAPDGTGYDGIDFVAYGEEVRIDNNKYEYAVEYLKFADGTILNTWDLIAPTDMALSTTVVAENSAAGSVVGTLTTTDKSTLRGSETFSYELVGGDDGPFAIDGDKIVVKAGASLDYESATSHSIRVRVTDGDGHTFDKTFTISVTDDTNENSAPTDILPDEASIAENSANGTEVATLSAVDPDTGDTFTYTLVDDAGGRFKIIDGKLVVADSTGLDYEAATEHTVTVRVTDSAGNALEQDITINVTDVAENTAATVSLANMRTSIAENTSTAQRIKVADIVVNDDGVGTNTLGLVGRNAALFEIIGMALFLKAGVALDARTMTTLDVAVTVDDDTIDGTPDHTSSTYKLAVADVAGVTVINGNSGNNTLTGTSGNDYFDGHGGSDTFKGGKGNDVYVVDSAGDKVIEAAGQGTDTVHASVSHTLATNVEYLMLQGTGAINGTGNASNNLLVGNSGNNTLAGGAGNDRLYGGAGNDTLDGGTGNDRLFGQDGNDTLLGGTGDDRLDGGIGRDVLRGGTGKDVFVFNEVSESAVGSARDVITDFMRGQDKIDLSAIDAREATAANDAFTWFGTKAFTGAAGQLRFNDLGAEVFVQGDVNGDGVADFEIHVKVATVAASDFIL
jgi:Ca2+-binding RTX toxin-like protein